MALLRLMEQMAEHSTFVIPPDHSGQRPVYRPAEGAGWGLIFRRSNRRNKPVTRLWDRLNILVVAWLLIECLAQSGYIPVQIAFFNEAVGPNVLHQIFFCDHLAGAFQKDFKNSEDRRRDRFGVACSADQELSRVYTKIVEFEYPSFGEHAAIKSMCRPK